MINYENNGKIKNIEQLEFSPRTMGTLKAGVKHIEMLSRVKKKVIVNQSDLAKHLGIDETSISKIAGILEGELNLIQRVNGAELRKIPNLKAKMDLDPNTVKSRQKYIFLSERGEELVKDLNRVCYNLEFSPVQVPLWRSKSLKEEEREKINEIIENIGEKQEDPPFIAFYINQLISIIKSKFIPAHRHELLYEILYELTGNQDAEVRNKAIMAMSNLWRIAIIYYDQVWLRDHPWDKLWKIFENIEDSEVGLKIDLLGNAMELLLRAYTLFREKCIPEELLDHLIEKYVVSLEFLIDGGAVGGKESLYGRWEKILCKDIRFDQDMKYVKDSLLRRISNPSINPNTKKTVLKMLSGTEYCLI